MTRNPTPVTAQPSRREFIWQHISGVLLHGSSQRASAFAFMLPTNSDTAAQRRVCRGAKLLFITAA